MTANGSRRAFGLAAGLALLMHLAIFVAVRPSTGDALAGPLVAPETHYLAKAAEALPVEGTDARILGSPLLFSLPSEMGFSRDLLNDNLRTRLPLTFETESESFLEINSGLGRDHSSVSRKELMLTATARPAPGVPESGGVSGGKRPSARRVYVAPELKARLEGGIVLPPELNQEAETAWEIRASVSISGQGLVKHVFLDQPLESSELNSQVLRLLYGLHFKSGKGPVDGRIEIYSPESSSGNGGTQP